MSHFEGLSCILLLLVLFISEFMCNDLLDLNYKHGKRIVGGYKCNITKTPFMVDVRLNVRPNGNNHYKHYCGGTIVSKKWVLSAAHCYIDEEFIIDIDDYLVVAGISKLSDFLHAQKRKVEAIVTGEYDSVTKVEDIALLKLKIPLTKTEAVQFVTLPKASTFPTDISEKYKKCTAMGWGMTAKVDFEGTVSPNDADDVYPDYLMCVELPPIEISKCRKSFHALGAEVTITNNHICTLYPDPEGGKDACMGDSGGPLICGRLQHGITSWGIGCAQPGVPGVFTRVDKYIDWIKLNTDKLPADNITWNDVTWNDITWDDTTWDDVIWNTMNWNRKMKHNGTSNNSLENSVILLLTFSNLLSIWKCTCLN